MTKVAGKTWLLHVLTKELTCMGNDYLKFFWLLLSFKEKMSGKSLTILENLNIISDSLHLRKTGSNSGLVFFVTFSYVLFSILSGYYFPVMKYLQERIFGVINMKRPFLSAKLVIRFALFLWRIFHIIAQFLQMAFQKEQTPLAFCARDTCRAQKWYSTGHGGTCYP